jgi:NAD(P)-dependent dehydrogenase (short-subunit alcohol dehydrogenase family)
MSVRIALVTGASRGIGAAVAERLRGNGFEVLSPPRSELDLLDNASIDAYLARLDRAVDVLVNNAGINVLGEATEYRDDDLRPMMQVNLLAPLRLAQRLAVGMARRGYGRIVNISSVWSLVTRPRRAVYSTTKAALNGLTRSLAVELAPRGVLVNAVAPGYVETALTLQNNSPQELEVIRQSVPLRRLAQPAEIAEVVAFLASDRNTYMTGQVIVVDGGFTCL